MNWPIFGRTTKNLAIFISPKHFGPSLVVKQQSRNMSERKDHLELTADQFRDPGVSPARVVFITNLSDTVKGLSLEVLDKSQNFHPGQWLDFFIPGEEKVGGFSMCSSPIQLESSKLLELAVKFSTWPPANWIHTKCKVDDVITFKFGGDFYYPRDGISDKHSLLLIAGGVGINPLYSIWNHTSQLLKSKASGAPQSVSLLYSATCTNELIFSSNITEIANNLTEMSCQYFITREEVTDFPNTSRRIDKTDLEKEIHKNSGSELICFICGPPSMVNQVNTWLKELGVSSNNIKFELWW